MYLLKVIRTNEWWNHKIPILLTVGYLTILQEHFFATEAIKVLAFYFLIIFLGASSISILNNIADQEEDTISNKPVFLPKVSSSSHAWGIPMLLFVVIFLLLAFFVFPDIHSIALTLSSICCFILYSTPPFRLKEKGIWGVLSDALGAHFFPTLLIISMLLYAKDQETLFADYHPSLIWIMMWALLLGIRGILWHQYSDRANDIQAGINTFAVKEPPSVIKKIEKIIPVIELLLVFLTLWPFNSIFILAAFLMYVFYLLWQKYRLNNQWVIILTPSKKSFTILFDDFYKSFLPIGILLQIAIYDDSKFFWLIPAHMLLFYSNYKNILRDLYRGLRRKIQ